MSKLEFKFGKSMVMSVLFFVTAFSLIVGGHHYQGSYWNQAHIWSGALLLIGSATHLITNRKWWRAVFSRPAIEMKPSLRRLRTTNLLLSVIGSLCAISAVIWLLPLGAEANHHWFATHTASGVFMFFLLGLHLLLHWGWLVNTIRHLAGSSSKQQPSLPENRVS